MTSHRSTCPEFKDKCGSCGRHKDMWGTIGTAPSTLTSALNGGEWSGLHTGSLTSGEPSPVPTEQQTGCDPTQPVWAPRKRENLLSLLGIEIQIFGCPGKIVMNDKWKMVREELSKNLKKKEENLD